MGFLSVPLIYGEKALNISLSTYQNKTI
jgi:hypothetical protein